MQLCNPVLTGGPLSFGPCLNMKVSNLNWSYLTQSMSVVSLALRMDRVIYYRQIMHCTPT